MTKKSEELDKLWRLHHAAYLQGNGDSYKNQLIEVSLYYIENIAYEICLGVPPNIELNDLKSEGVFGAIEAIKSFNPNKSRFVTHLDRRVRSKLLDYIRKEDCNPRLVRLRSNQLKKAKNKLKSKLGCEPTEHQLIKELSKDSYVFSYSSKTRNKIKGEEKARLIIQDAKNLKTRGYVFPINNLGDENREVFDGEDRRCLKDKKAKNPLYEAQRKDLKDFLYNELTRREKLILNLYYFTFYTQDKNGRLGMPQREIGNLLELHESRISQIHSALLPRLKAKLTEKGLTLETCLNNL